MSLLTPDELAQLWPAEASRLRAPIPVESVSSDEFMPSPRTARQRELEARLSARGTELARRHGMTQRAFFRTAAGMATAFVAMNETYGRLYDASPAEAATPELAQARAESLRGQFVMDMHTHFLRDDTRLTGFVRAR